MMRREFLRDAAIAAAALTLPSLAQTPPAAKLLRDEDAPALIVPKDFLGLSYETAQLANPAFFAATNKPLIALFRELSISGVLRLGGGSSEFATYSEQDPVAPPPFEVFGPDTSHTVKQGTTTTALAIRNLCSFLDATGWNCIYGLNLGQGSKEDAAREAVAVARILGPRLLALQIGNEPDSFRNRYRPANYGPADFLAEWNTFHAAIVSALDAAHLKASFAGPDISNKLPYLTAFAAEAPKHPDIAFLTGHYYAMGPAGNPDATLANMLLPDPKLTTLKQRDFPVVLDAMKSANRPFRIAEMNSCWNGGQVGASDTFASALWCADAMLRFASLGFSGVNLHGGGNGIYSPIVGSSSHGFSRRPEFFGIKFVQQLAGAHLYPCHLETPDDRITAYMFSKLKNDFLALINKSDQSIHVATPMQHASVQWTLTAPTLDNKDAITLTQSKPASLRGNLVVLPPHTALLLRS